MNLISKMFHQDVKMFLLYDQLYYYTTIFLYNMSYFKYI